MEEVPEEKLRRVGDTLLDWMEKNDEFLEVLKRVSKKDPDFILDNFRKLWVLELRSHPQAFMEFLKEMVEDIRMKKPENEGINQTFDTFSSQTLFQQFTEDMSRSSFKFDIIPFSIVYSWFSWKRIDKENAKLIINMWVKKRLCERSKFHGLKIIDNSK